MRIALIENNGFDALLFERAVREKYPGFTVTVYPTADAFLQDFPRTAYDIIAVDLGLPDMDGLRLIRLVRRGNGQVPIVMITDAGSEETTAEAMKAGATDYIAKNGDYGRVIPRVIRHAYRKQCLILKNRRLDAAVRDAEKLEIITTTASTLNHEINNPLMAILGNVELLLGDYQIVDQNMIDKLMMIESSARRIQAITHQLANLISPSIRQTPAGPMLRLVRTGESCNESSAAQMTTTTQKSD